MKFGSRPVLLVPMALVSIGLLAMAPQGRGPAIKGDATAVSYHLVWKASLDANADSTPATEKRVTLSNGKVVMLVFVLAGNNSSDCDPGSPVSPATLYAFNATTGDRVWKESTKGKGRCTTSAPAVSGSFVYAPGLDGYIHKYAVATGKEYKGHGWPERFTRQSYVEKESANLIVSGQYLYATTSGFIGDAGHYEGHVVTVNLTTGHKSVWNSLCSRNHRLITKSPGSGSYCKYAQSGLFGRGQAAIDPLNKDIYIATGNGPWSGKTNWGDSVLKLNPLGTKLIDAFTPKNHAYLNHSDNDLGSTGPAILPPVRSDGKTWNLLVQGGKGPYNSHSGPTVLWLVNRDQMGHKPGPGHLGGQLQHIESPGGCEVLTAPAIAEGTTTTGPLVIYGNDCGVTAYRVVTGASTIPHLAVLWSQSTGSTTPVVSEGIMYLAHNGEIAAYDPDGGEKLWSSTAANAGGTIGNVHWEYPHVAGKWLLITDEDGKLFAYKIKVS